MHPRKFIRDSLGFAATQYVIRALLILRAVFAARLLGPLQMGGWNALQLIMDYGTLAPLGTQQGLDQAVPPRIVENDPRRLERLERAGLFNVLLTSVLFAAAALTYMLASPSKIIAFWGVPGALVALLCMTLVNIAFYHTTLLRSHGNIKAVSLWYFLQGAIGTVLGLGLIPWLGVWALLVGWATATLVATTWARVQSRGVVPLIPRPSSDSLDLLKIGLPMFGFSASVLVMRSLDRIIIFKFLPTLAFGYYTIAITVFNALMSLPDSITYVLYPRLLREFRQAENQPEAIRWRVERSVQGLALLLPVLCGVAYLCSREAVLLVLPKFLPGINAVRVLCFGVTGFAIANLCSIVLMTLGRRLQLVPAAVAMVLIGATADLVAVHSVAGVPVEMRGNEGITRVAWATLGSFTLGGVLLMMLAWSGLGIRGGRRIVAVLRAFVPLALAMALAYGADKLVPWATSHANGWSVLHVLLSVSVFVGAYALVVTPLARGLGLGQLLLEFNLPLPWFGRRVEAPRE